MEFNIPRQETIIHSFPPFSFPFSSQLLAFATAEARILQNFFHHTHSNSSQKQSLVGKERLESMQKVKM